MMRLPYDLEARRPWLVPEVPEAEHARRLATLRSALAAAGLDALVAWSGPPAFAAARWLSGLQPVYGNAFVVVRADGRLSVTMDGLLHAEPMHSMAWTCRVEDLRCTPGPLYGRPVEEAALLAADAVGRARRIGLAGGALMPHGLRAALDARLPGLVPADALLARARMLKSPVEVALMERAAAAADAAYEAIFDTLAPGVEESEVAATAVAAIARAGGREAFPTCVVGGALAGLKHALPRRRRLEPGEMVFLDLGAVIDGYCSDVSRCTLVGGRAAGAAADLLAVAEELWAAGLEAMRPGRSVDEVAQALSRVVRGTRWEQDFYGSGFGHGIGLELFEAPGGLYAGSPTLLEPGMTLAYEPMVVVAGLGTGVVEDTLLITEDGHRLLSRARRRA
jgi:Xaa-Pro aminopeptidase